MKDALCTIGQTMAGLGFTDHHLTSPGRLEYCLSQQLKNYRNIDPEPSQVKPVPLSVVHMCIVQACQSAHPFDVAVTNMLTIGFYYLCHPGEHALSTEGSHSYTFHVTFHQGAHALQTQTAPFMELHSSTFALLTYTDQKNAVCGETIGHGRTRDPYLGPVKALARHIEHLHLHHAPPETPLHAVYTNSHICHIRSRDITAALRSAAALVFHETGIHPSDIYSHGLQSGGAMALLCA